MPEPTESAEPTARPPSTAVPEPTATAIAEPTPTLEPLAPPTEREPFRMQIFMHLDEGRLTDEGEYIPDHPEGAMTWRMQLDVDVDAGYVFWTLDGVAEAGDGGCTEYLEIPAGTYGRSTIGEGSSLDFEPTDEYGDRILDEVVDEVPLASESVWGRLDIEPTVEVDPAGVEIEVAELDETSTALALELLPDLGGIQTEFQSSRLETTRNDRGDIVQTRIVADYAGPSRPYNNATARSVETLEIVQRIDLLPGDERVTVDTPILRPGGCKPATAGIAGTWSLLSFIGGSELPGRLLEQVGRASVTFEADGSLSGTFGCRTFEGTGAVEYSSIEQVAIEVQGTPCTSGQFDERLYEDWLVEVFSDDMQAFVDLEDRLFVFPADGEPEVVVVFRRVE